MNKRTAAHTGLLNKHLTKDLPAPLIRIAITTQILHLPLRTLEVAIMVHR